MKTVDIQPRNQNYIIFILKKNIHTAQHYLNSTTKGISSLIIQVLRVCSFKWISYCWFIIVPQKCVQTITRNLKNFSYNVDNIVSPTSESFKIYFICRVFSNFIWICIIPISLSPLDLNAQNVLICMLIMIYKIKYLVENTYKIRQLSLLNYDHSLLKSFNVIKWDVILKIILIHYRLK